MRFIEQILQFPFNSFSSSNMCVRRTVQTIKRDTTQYFFSFLDAFANLRKATISFVMSVRPSVRMEQLGPHWTGFHES